LPRACNMTGDGTKDEMSVHPASEQQEAAASSALDASGDADISSGTDGSGSPMTNANEHLPLSWLHLIGELLIIIGAFALAHFIRYTSGILPAPTEFIPLSQYMVMGVIVAPLWILLHLGHGLYFQKIAGTASEEIGALVNAQVQGFLLLILMSFFIRNFPSSRLTLILILVSALAGCLVFRLILRAGRTFLLRRGIGIRPLIVIGDSPLGALLIRRIEKNTALGLKVRERVALLDVPCGNVSAIIRHLLSDSPEIPAVLIAGNIPEDCVSEVIVECHRAGVECILPSERSAAAGLPTDARMMEGVPVLKLTAAGELAWIRFKKRVFDLFIVILVSPLWIPVMVLIALLSIILQGFPILFKHKRLGRAGREIVTHKFRTMVRNAHLISLPDDFDEKYKSKDDPRVTKWGRMLRKLSLDELPQVLDILGGNISLVGPRPIVKDELSRYGAWAELLLSVPPGLTGLWQVSGRSDLSYEQRVELDTYYIHNWSLALDIQILMQTIPAVLLRKGAY